MPTTNDAPHIIPSLREWVAGKGKLFVTADSRLVVDTAHAADLLNTANTFQTLVPEIDLPAHATTITSYDPTLAFDCESMSYARWPGGDLGGWTIDYADPKARQWMKDLMNEFTLLFDGPYFHIGTDKVPEREKLDACRQLIFRSPVAPAPRDFGGENLVWWHAIKTADRVSGIA